MAVKVDPGGNRWQESPESPPRLTPSSPLRHLPRASDTGTRAGKPAYSPYGSTNGVAVRYVLPIVLFAAISGVFACSPDGPGTDSVPTISREAFIEAYVELRVGALRSPREELPVPDRDRILEGLGLDDEDLLHFVEVNGRDVQFMRRVWEEVDSLMTELRDPNRIRDRVGEAT